MQSIINSIVKNRNLIIYIVLSLITFNFLYQKGPIHSTNIGKIATFISGTSSSFSSSVSSYFSLRSKNQKLITENLELKKVESKYNILSQNTENLSILSGPITSAEVILNSVNKNKNIIVINKGLSEGVNKEMGVISSNGIVGIVKNVTDNYSSIISLLNIDLKINAILKKSSTLGSISWDGKNPKIVKLNDIPLSSSIKVGDTIITGGMSFYFPKGIPIGEIIDYDNSSLEGYYEIDILIFNDFSSLSNVYVIDRSDNEEIKDLLYE